MRHSYRRAMTAFVMGLGLSLNAYVLADSSDLLTQLQSRYSSLNAAMSSGDTSTLRTLLAGNYTIVQADGSTKDVNGFLAGVTSTGNGSTSTSTTVLAVTDNGGTATVSQSSHVSAQRTNPDGSPLAADGTVQVTDSWTNASGTWLLQQSIVNHYTYTINGKTVSR